MKTTIFKIFTIVFAMFTLNTFAQTNKNIDLNSSSIHWLAKKIVGQHEGTINFQSGHLEMTNDKLTGGYFVVDMTTLTATDLTGDYLGKLNGHLKNEDFFDVANHPTSTLKFTSVKENSTNNYTVSGDLIIKNIKKPITFDITLAPKEAKTKLTVDRTEYNIKYASGSFFENLGDKTIEDNFTLDIVLKY